MEYSPKTGSKKPRKKLGHDADPGRTNSHRRTPTLYAAVDQNNKSLRRNASENGLQSTNLTEFTSLQPDTTPPSITAVQRLSTPVAQLANVFTLMLDYKEDAESAAETAPKLMAILDTECETETLVKTLQFIQKLARMEASREGLASCPQLINGIIQLLQTTAHPEVQSESALALHQLSRSETVARLISQKMGIELLVKMLNHPSDTLLFTALFILHQLMWHMPNEARTEVRACGGHLKLVHLLRKEPPMDAKWIAVAVDAIRMVAFDDVETKLDLLKTDLHEDVVELLHKYSDDKRTAYNISRLIKVLSVCNNNKPKLVEVGAVEALATLLLSDHSIIQLEALWGLRNISDHAYHLENTELLISRLIQCVMSSDENISICATGCLCNLTCQNAHNKLLVIENGGVTVLCRQMIENAKRQEVTEPASSALRHLTHRNPHTASAIYQIRQAKAIPTIVKILSQNRTITALPLIRSMVGLCRNLAMDDEARRELRRCGVTSHLVNILKEVHTLACPQAGHRGSVTMEFGQVDCIEGVYFEDMLEVTLAAFQSLSKDNEIRDELIHSPGLLTIVVQVMHFTFESLQRAATGLLGQLATCKKGCLAIEQEGAIPRLTELIQSSNEAIAAYSASVLHRVAKDKPSDYRRRLSIELRQSLFDSGLLNEGEGIPAVEEWQTNASSTRSHPSA